MKITQSTGITNVLKAYGKTTKRVAHTNAVAADKVEISELAKEIQSARKAFELLPEIREDKVSEIKKLMASGQYRPSAEDVIDKLLGR